ncbi:Mediator of rna polymerase ii transcription subunit [Thalictrum thalictroides]|uniref:Mediator of rna polymerase ii transcription subunit n=1 Tax=Thalictrum thalictroides TaxID=46969 RepID=A0A7J6UZM9_THATH|nr:Mediator of rna polymerase ii transcription subunit [Thalictrum thalictroides]
MLLHHGAPVGSNKNFRMCVLKMQQNFLHRHNANNGGMVMVIPSIAMVETYVRLLLIHPHSLFRSHFTVLTQRSPSILSKSGVSLLLLEILNYRLIPLYRYHGKSKALMQDVTKLVSMLKGKRGDHRVFRLAENLSLNLIFSLRDIFMIKREVKGPSEFTETLNRVAVISLAITIKTRGVAEVEHLLFLPSLLDQIMATCQHTWSEKTLRYFPPLIRDILMGRTEKIDKRGHAIQAWQQVETTVINQCTQLLSPAADPPYLMTYINHSFPQHRQYLCAGAWMLMHGHPENINSVNLARVLREFSPEEVTSNIYTMVDVLLHHIHTELQHGHLLQDLLLKASSNLSFFIWNHELLPFDVLLLALIDRDDDPHALRIVLSLIDRQELQQRIKLFNLNRGPPEHWLYAGIFKRNDLQKALGSHLSWKERSPPFFDDIAARLLPIILLIIYRLIENDITDTAEKVIALFNPFLAYYPMRFTFVRDILAYFYGHLPNKLVLRLLGILDLPKIPFSESFPLHIRSSNPVICPPQDYFATLLLSLVNYVIPPLTSKSKSGSTADVSSNAFHGVHNKTSASSQSGATNLSEGQKAFYQNQDPGTYTQLVLETAVIELLSLPITPTQIVSSLLQVVVHVQPTLIQSSNGLQGTSSSAGQGSVLPTSPSGGSTDSLGTNRSTPSASGINAANFVSRSGYSCQQLSCLLIQACGLLLAQLPTEFHAQLYLEASSIIKDCWWLTDKKSSQKELDTAIGYTLLDPTWAAQDNTSTAIGNIVALLHSFFSNLPQEWLEGTPAIIKHLKPVTSVAMLRLTFRIMGPLLPRLAAARPLFGKTLALLLNGISDVFGKNSQPSTPNEASGVADLIDFLYHLILYEGQGGPVQTTSKPKLDTLSTCGKLMEMLRPDIQHLLCHLRIDTNTSIYAATHPKLGKLEDGREVAVKKLSQSSRQGKKEFMNEAKLLARVQHRNVVNLLGYCIHGTEKLLVYEYLPHQSLDKFLFYSRKREELDWRKSGQKNSTFSSNNDAQNLLEWAWKLYKKERSLEMMDVVMASGEDTEQVAVCIKIGLLCVQADPKLRPNMRRVVVMLTKKSSNLEEPTKPGHAGYRYRRVGRPAGSSSTAGSGEPSLRPAISGSSTDSSGKSSQNFDSTFNASSSSTSTNTRPNRNRTHGTHSPTHTMRRSSHSQDEHNTLSSNISEPSAEHSRGKRPIQKP